VFRGREHGHVGTDLSEDAFCGDGGQTRDRREQVPFGRQITFAGSLDVEVVPWDLTSLTGVDQTSPLYL
jgi:hypothetical protein